MRFVLSDQEILEALRSGERRSDGYLVIDIPDGRLQGIHKSTVVLSFSDESRTVNYGKRSLRLSPKQYALLKTVHEHGQSSFEDLQDSVWPGNATDNAVRLTCSKLSAKLADAEIPLVITSQRGRVSIEDCSAF